MMPRDILGIPERASIARSITAPSVFAFVLKLTIEAFRLIGSVCGSSLMFSIAAGGSQPDGRHPLFRHFNRRIDDIHFRARGDHAVERFDVVIAQANAAGADAHPIPKSAFVPCRR